MFIILGFAMVVVKLVAKFLNLGWD